MDIPERLEELHKLLGVDLVLYEDDGDLVASAGDSVPPIDAVEVPVPDDAGHGRDGWQ